MASITEQTSECPTLSYHALYRLPTGYASEVWQVPWRVRRYTHHTETTCIWWILMPSHPLKKWIVTDKTICIWNEQVCILSSISVFRMADGSLTYTLKVLTWPVTFALCLFRFQDTQHYTNNSQKLTYCISAKTMKLVEIQLKTNRQHHDLQHQKGK